MAGTGDGDPIAAGGDPDAGRDAVAARESTAAREPLVGADPLGLGGTTAPDAPSRRPRPRILALLGEFFRMSRPTVLLLAAFLLVGALYLLVREDPVVNFGPPAPAPSPTAPPTTGDTPAPSTEEPTATTGSPTPTSPTGSETSERQRTSVPADTPTPEGTGADRGGGAAPAEEPQGATQERQQAPGGVTVEQRPQPTG